MTNILKLVGLYKPSEACKRTYSINSKIEWGGYHVNENSLFLCVEENREYYLFLYDNKFFQCYKEFLHHLEEILV